MSIIKRRDVGFMVGGVLLGTVGFKALTSKSAKKLYVQGIAAGMRCKDSYQDMVEQARCEVDGMVEAARYENETAAQKA